MKHIINTFIALFALTLGVQAQQRNIPALQITLKDGTVDTIYSSDMKMYGLENATVNDYIQAMFTQNTSPYMFDFSVTTYAYEAPYDELGYIISEKPIPDDLAVPAKGYSVPFNRGCLYVYLNGDWNTRGTVFYSFRSVEFRPDKKEYELGATYYGRGFYTLDGKTYYTQQSTARRPKTIEAVQQRDGLVINRNSTNTAVVVTLPKTATETFVQKYGNDSPYMEYALQNDKKEYVSTLSDEQIKSLAYKTEECDDGNIYFINLTDKYINDFFNETEALGNETLYIPANLTTALPEAAGSFYFGYSGCRLEMKECEPLWGVKDNQYLQTVNKTLTSKPQVAIEIKRVMLPNKKYNITFSLAPQTDATSTDNKPLMFYAYMAEGNNTDIENETFPTAQNKRTNLYNPNITEGTVIQKRTFEGSPTEVTTYTVEYTPTTFAYNHAFMIQNSKTMTSSNRNKYGQNIRLIGVEITPAE